MRSEQRWHWNRVRPIEYHPLAEVRVGAFDNLSPPDIFEIYREHKNTHPVTGEPLDPSELITLNYSRNSNGELNDPVTFKVLSEHSYIVAIAATGNVFLADTVKQFAVSGKDLVSDQDFKKSVACSISPPCPGLI
jgi:hypothetical protein